MMLSYSFIYFFSFFPDVCRGYVKGQSVDDALARTAYLLDHDLLIPALAELVRTYSRGNVDRLRVSYKKIIFSPYLVLKNVINLLSFLRHLS